MRPVNPVPIHQRFKQAFSVSQTGRTLGNEVFAVRLRVAEPAILGGWSSIRKLRTCRRLATCQA